MSAEELDDQTQEWSENLEKSDVFDWSRSSDEIRELTDSWPEEVIEVLADEYRDGSIRKILEYFVDLGVSFEPERHADELAERLARRRLVRMAEKVGVEPAAITRHFARRG